MTVEELRVGQLYTVAKQSVEETDKSQAVEILLNEPFDDFYAEKEQKSLPSESELEAVSSEQASNPGGSPESTVSTPDRHAANAKIVSPLLAPSLLSRDKHRGQFTHKLYHAGTGAPSFLSALAPPSALRMHENAWNAYPYCHTKLHSDYFQHFSVSIETVHRDDHGEEENIFGLTRQQLAKREVMWVDIAEEQDERGERYRAEHDPRYFRSERTGRGPLGPDWREASPQQHPIMCVYKLAQLDIFKRFYKRTFCEIDDWIDLTMEDIRKLEEETRHILQEKLDGLDLATRTPNV